MEVNKGEFFNYFKQCYQLDYREFNLDNILSKKYPFKWFVSKTEELLDKSLPLIPYPNKKIDDIQKEIELYKLEKKLFYASFFVIGKNVNPLFKDQTICSPLLLFPANIVTLDENSFLEIDVNSFIVNRSILEKFEDDSSETSKDVFLSQLSDITMNEQDRFVGLNKLFETHFKNVDSTELIFYPEVWSESKIKSYLKTTELVENQFKIVPAAGTILIEKSESSLKVLNDLTQLGKRGEFSLCLDELLSSKPISQQAFSKSYFHNRLNTSQNIALQNASKFNNSVIIGPPGTGKSYTITSIVLDALTNNKSVLVVSKTKQAVEVLRSMIEDQFDLKNYLIHTSGVNYRVSLKAKIKRYLAGIREHSNVQLMDAELFYQFTKQQLLEVKYEKIVNREIKLSLLSSKKSKSLKEIIQKSYLTARYFNREKLWNEFHKLSLIRTVIEKEVKIYSKRKIKNNINKNLSKHRSDLALFFDALEAENFTTYKSSMAKVKHENIVKIFPIWLANLSELNSVLPLQKELFDLVIIDESTQCDVASALPALYRAKRAVVVGDPNQLRHYSFISKQQQRDLRKKYNLPEDKIYDYRNRSLLDIFLSKIQSQDQVSFLREHYRSTPSIIEFSNQHFYGNQLEILKSTPKYSDYKQIEIINSNGIRNQKGINEKETELILIKLDELIQLHSSEITPPSIGIISPFSSQVTYINSELKKKYELKTLKKFDLVCGTPYNFQGSEREIILLSFNVSGESHHSAFRHVNQPEVLNVAITRAKSYQYIFKSFETKEINEDSLLYKYISFIQNFLYANKQVIETDLFQQELYDELSLTYDTIKCGYPIAGTILDILIIHENKNYFIDLIGYPGQYTAAFTNERYATLHRVGINSLPIHYSIWVKDRKRVLEKIASFVQNTI
ncbi:MAG: AAA domain-containing protein [Bacteroidota bacterium]